MICIVIYLMIDMIHIICSKYRLHWYISKWYTALIIIIVDICVLVWLGILDYWVFQIFFDLWMLIFVIYVYMDLHIFPKSLRSHFSKLKKLRLACFLSPMEYSSKVNLNFITHLILKVCVGSHWGSVQFLQQKVCKE